MKGSSRKKKIYSASQKRKEEVKRSWKSMKMKTQPTRTYGTQQRQSKEESLQP
jgi:hypothetical protein